MPVTAQDYQIIWKEILNTGRVNELKRIQNNYGNVAILAVEFLRKIDKNNLITENYLIDVWEDSFCKFSDSKTSIKKPCPKEVFIGLVLKGHINGIQRTNINFRSKNYNYVKKGIEIIENIKSEYPNLIYMEIIDVIINGFEFKGEKNKVEIYKGEVGFFKLIMELLKEDVSKKYNSQIHILFALIRNGYLNL
ncbi:MAG: hypothetical protein QM539_09860 [Alphaproteobacteria bacterium]|nr:hypothetical protein [Alphaproteobacteria bacterium]